MAWSVRALFRSRGYLHKYASERACSTGTRRITFAEKSLQNTAVERGRVDTAWEEQQMMKSGGWEAAIPTQSERLEYDVEGLGEELMEKGFLRFDKIVSEADALNLREHVDGLLESSIKEVTESRAFLDRFGPVMCRENRFDLLLPLDETVLNASQKVLRKLSPLITEVSGDTASLCELSSLISDPGSHAQPVHHDTQFDGSFPRFSILIGLQNISPDMGPTGLFPHTNTPDWHCAFAQRGEELEFLFEETRHVLATLGAGDVLIYDTNVLHFGGGNSSNTRRSLFVLSFQIDKGKSAENHSNIQSGYRKKYPLSAFETWQVCEK